MGQINKIKKRKKCKILVLKTEGIAEHLCRQFFILFLAVV